VALDAEGDLCIEFAQFAEDVEVASRECAIPLGALNQIQKDLDHIRVGTGEPVPQVLQIDVTTDLVPAGPFTILPDPFHRSSGGPLGTAR
jgi:hypothetical protein